MLISQLQRISWIALVLVALASTANSQGFPGGGGGHDIDIVDVTYSNTTVTVEYTLARDFEDIPSPIASAKTYGGATTDIKVMDDYLETPSGQSYTIDLAIAQTQGDFQVCLALEGIFPYDGVTAVVDFEIDSDGDLTYETPAIVDAYAPALGNIPFVPPKEPCLEPERGNGLIRIAPAGGSQFEIPFFMVTSSVNPISCPSGGGCSRCGGTSDSSVNPFLCFNMNVQMQSSVMGGTAGPGIFLCFDKRGYIAASEDDGTEVVLRIADPEKCGLIVMSDDESGTVDGNLACKHKEYASGKLTKSNGTLTSDLTEATYVEITRIDGSVLVFELYDLNQTDDSDLDSLMRLIRIEKNGRTLVTLRYNAYKGIPYEMEDYLGFKMTFEATATVGGREALSKVTYAGKSIDITYSGLFPQLEYPDGEDFKTTLTSTASGDKLKVESPFAPTKYYYFTQQYNVAGTIINLPNKVLTGVKESTDTDYLWAISYNSGNGAQARILKEGKTLQLYHNDDDDERSIRYYDAWTLANWDNWAATGFTTESQYPELEYDAIGTDDTRRSYQAAQTVILETGEEVEVEYDSFYRRTKRTYEDGDVETWEYDSDGNLTRYEDRNDHVTKYVYDSTSKLMTEKKVGIKNTGTKSSPTDQNQTASVSASGKDEYAVYKYDYYTTGQKKGMLKTEKMAKWTSQTDLYRTDYDYTFTSGVLTEIEVTESADVASGTRPVTTQDINSAGLVSKSTDPINREVEFFYDNLHRLYKTEYHDGSTEKDYFYSTVGKEGLVEKSKDRNGVATKFEYDALNRVTKITQGYSTISSTDTETVNTDVLTKSITEYYYVGDSDRIDYQVINGKKTSYEYDHQGRTTEVSVYPYTGKTLTTETVYDSQNRLFYTEDPYGRREYVGYSASNTTEQIRRIQCTVSTQTYATNTAILNATRSSGTNAAFIITDAVKDGEGNLTESIDANNISTVYKYDSRNREYERLDAEGETIEAKTVTYYDLDSNVTEIRSPRYYDSNDTDGHNKAVTTYTYNGRGLRSSTVQADGSSDETTTSVTYTLDGSVDTTTDGRNNDWKSYWHTCCGRPQGSTDPVGHGLIFNNDYMGRVTHAAQVSDYSTHSNKHNPTDAKTLGESTTRYDILGRSIANTQWLSVRGTVDENDPPIAGLDSISAADGITTQTIYDNDLKDNVGLDNSTGTTVDKLGGGTFNVSLANALTQLADTVANGGAAMSFTADVSSGSAVVQINGEEEISFSISDAVGRTVMNGQIQSYTDTSPNSLIVYSCMSYDNSATITGFGSTLETWVIDANGEKTKRRVDGAGRPLETEDKDGNVSTAKFDNNGNVKERRDSNGVGFDFVYDARNRPTSKTDTWGDVTTTAYYLGGMVKTQTDEKSKSSTIAYDSVGRRKTFSDRLGNDTDYTYDDNGNLLSITDAESRVTSHLYNSRNLKTKTTYPDHSGGSSGSSTYGIVEFDYDDAGRLEVKTDQLGETVTFVYDLAGRLEQRDYRTKANSPSGTIADSDEFTYDKSGRTLTAESGRYSNTVTMTYDMAGRLEDESLEIGTRTYTVGREYNDLGQLSKLTYPDGTEVDRTYTDRGQLHLVKYDSITIDTRVYDAGGRLSTSTYDNGVVSTYNYRSSSGDKDNLISSIVTTNSGTEKIGTYTYTYDGNKNKTKETITGSSINNKSFDTTLGTDADGYDDDDRLTYWERSDSNRKLEWTLTDVGDWSALKLNGTSTIRTHSNSHETTAVGVSALTYDAKGNLTNDATKSQDYEWDFDNRMTSVDDGTTENIAKYDALGRRVQFGTSASPSTYVYAGQQMISRYSNNGAPASPLQKWVYGSYIDEPIMMDRRVSSTWSQYYYSRNQQYSVTGLTDSSGDVVERYVYDAYGNTTIYAPNGTTTRSSSSYTNYFMYTGRYNHSSFDIYYFRARMYDPALGRFFSRDPLGYIDGMSLYSAYFAPNGTDPRGMFHERPVGNVGPEDRHLGCNKCQSGQKCRELIGNMTCWLKEYLARLKDWDRDKYNDRGNYADHIKKIPYWQNGVFSRTNAYQKWWEKAMEIYRKMANHREQMKIAKSHAVNCFDRAIVECGKCKTCPRVPKLVFKPLPDLPISPSNVRYQHRSWDWGFEVKPELVGALAVVAVVVVGGVAIVASGGSATPLVIGSAACALAVIPAIGGEETGRIDGTL